ncbi:FAST kinase domain-containing protein 1, mitochondrial-like [Ptychodera flava]|uniref:FAST kinase domain-containing protein 1, mitochondrial-like n=1 Tax=Ptychodera flava TaxID=63121 RepID=UPI003969E379
MLSAAEMVTDTSGFDMVLSKDNQPLVCADYGSALNLTKGPKEGDTSHNIQWGVMQKQLPPGAQRVAIDYLGVKYFCSNMHHPMGYQQMKGRHLEIMG